LKDKDLWRFDPTLMDSGTEFLIDGINYGIELEVRGDNLPEDSFVLEEVHREGGPYVVHRALILAYSVASRRSYEHALDLVQRTKEIRKASNWLMLLLLVGCQINRPDREVSSDEAEAWPAERPDIVFAETSA
jgi:Ras family